MEILENKKFRIASIITAGLLVLLSVAYFLYTTLSLQEENKVIKNSFLRNYSQADFVKYSLKTANPYNREALEKFVKSKYLFFVRSNTDVKTAIQNYADLYNHSFEILLRLKKEKAIYSKDYKEIKKHLLKFRFAKISYKLQSINLKNSNANLLGLKSYFSGIVKELDFKTEMARIDYIEAKRLNGFEPLYYLALGDVYVKKYDFKSAIDVYKDGLLNANFKYKKNKTVQLNLLTNLANVYNIRNNNKETLNTYTDLLMYSHLFDNSKFQWIAIYNIALLKAENGEYLTSIDYLKHALIISRKIRNNQFMANTLNTLSNIQYYYGDYENGRKNALRSIKYAKKSTDLNLMANASLNACLNYDYLDESKLSTIYCNRSLEINNILAEILERPEYYIRNGFIYSYVAQFRNYKSSLMNYIKAYKIADKLKLRILEANALQGMSNSNLMLGNKDKAFTQLNMSMKIKKSFGINSNCCEDIKYGEYFWHTKNYELAISSYKQAIFKGLKNNNNYMVSMASSHLAMVYDDLKQYKEGYKYSNLALDTSKRIYRYDHHYIKFQKEWGDRLYYKMTKKENRDRNKQD